MTSSDQILLPKIPEAETVKGLDLIEERRQAFQDELVDFISPEVNILNNLDSSDLRRDIAFRKLRKKLKKAYR
jgi:hypothetical protein